MSDVPQLLTTDEVAAILGVSDRTVRKMGETGELERITIGYRTVRYDKADVIALVERSRAKRKADLYAPAAPWSSQD